MRYILLFIIVFIEVSSITAQDTLYYKECIEAAVQSAPRLKDKGLLIDQQILKNKNIKTAWYPQVELNGKVSYQSDVVSFQLDQPGMLFELPEMPNEQYGINLDVKQMIYDGGLTRVRKEYEQTATELSIEEVELDIQKIKERTTQAYFNVLLLIENRNNLEVMLHNLKVIEKQLHGSVSNGIATEADLKIIQVEILNILQNMSEVDATRYGFTDLIGLYTSSDIPEQTIFETPFLELPTDDSLKRTELNIFSLQKTLLDASSELKKVGRRPMFYAFGQAGAGMPGYNMLNSEFDTYYMIGAGLQWKIWDWNNAKRERQVLEKQKQMLDHGEASFEMGVISQQARQTRKMEHLKSSLELDDKMLQMRIELTRVAASQLENGTISASEYIQVLNNELITRISRSKHHIELMKSIATYNLLQGTV